MAENQNSTVAEGHKFGTFGGVFTPSILTIFGLIMFMRTTYVIGKGGIIWVLIILLIAETITIATGLSISAISTNTPVKGGGAYFLISRALGPGFGSSIGVALFFAQSLSVPFYILGFSEALVTNFPILNPYYLWICLGTGVVLTILTWIGADWTIKCQFFILAVLGLSIFAFMGGALMNFDFKVFQENLKPGPAPNIFVLFAIFFPAVTGIMAGINMSGDLKNPGKSLPLGTMMAIMFGMLIYALQIIICGGAFGRESLIQNPFGILVTNALFGATYLVVAGVVAATISSALGSLMGAPRVLQALAKDQIIPILNPFAKGSGIHNEPKRGLIFTFIITILVLIWGGLSGVSKSGSEQGALNLVAEIVTMFFLYTYGMVNLAAFVESYGANPSFRPRFKFYHWSTALYGGVACIIVSFCIDIGTSIAALLAIGTLFIFARRKEMAKTFGDARRGFIYSRIRNSLLLLSEMPPDPKNWRPTIAVLTGNPNTRVSLLEYSTLIECGRGIVSLVEFIVTEKNNINELREKALNDMKKFSEESQISVFPEVIVCQDFDQGLTTFLQAHSIGPVKPNIVMLGWPKEEERIVPFVSHLRTIFDLKISSIVFINPTEKICPKFATGRIDIWWRGQSNGSLMLILAHLLCLNDGWKTVKIRILRIASEQKTEKEEFDEMEKLVESGRINAEIKVIVSDESFHDVLRKESADAVVLFMGFIPPGEDLALPFYNSMNSRLKDMPHTFMVSSSGEADLLA